MTGHDPLEGLGALAHEAENHARPTAPDTIRELGTRRRRRRHIGIAAAAVVLAVAAGGTAVSLLPRTSAVPSPVGTPGLSAGPTPSGPASPSPVRTVGDGNLLTADEIAVYGEGHTVVVEPPANAAPEDASVCVPPDGYAQLGASGLVERDFRSDQQGRDYPLYGTPTIYTQSLQFPDQAAATRALTTYLGWLGEACWQRLLHDDLYEPVGSTYRNERLLKVSANGKTIAQFAVVPTYWLRDRDPKDESGWFATVGLVQRGDRIAVISYLDYGMDSNWSMDQNGDPDLAGPHPQFALLQTAYEHLAD